MCALIHAYVTGLDAYHESWQQKESIPIYTIPNHTKEDMELKTEEFIQCIRNVLKK